MIKPLSNYIKPGIVHFMIYPQVIKGEGPILETIQKIIVDDYFKVIEITWIKDLKVRAKAKAMLEASGLEVKYGGQPRLLTQQLNLNSLDADERARAIADMKEGIDETAEMGIPDFAILSGAYPGEDDKAEAMDLLVDSIDQICAYASERKISVVLEVFDQTIDKKCLIGPAADALELSERVCAKHNNFGLLVDLSHIPLLNESPAEALRPVAKYLKHIHIGNAYMDATGDPAYGDQHPRFGYPGGANDVDEIVDFLDELFNVGYLDASGSRPMPVSFEIKPLGDENPEGMIAQSKRKLNAAWIKLKER